MHAEEQNDLVGQTLLGKLRVLRRIGAGGMGAVYEVEHVLTRHRRALKVLHSELSSSSSAVARLIREAGVNARVKSPFVAETYDAGRVHDGGPAYILMELLEGQTLRQALVEQGRIEPARLLEIARQVCHGLGAVHDAGLIHRDIKPENIFLLGDPSRRVSVKILDFGVLAFADGKEDSLGKLTGDNAAAGTPIYMAPEQMSGGTVDRRADLYALGIVMYEALTGRPPFEGRNVAAIFRKAHRGEVGPLRDLAPEVDPSLAAIVEKAVQREPAARYASAQDLLAAIDLHAVSSADTRPTPRSPAGDRAPRDRPVSVLPVLPAEGKPIAGRFQVVRCIKTGGMGAVYEVIHLETRRRRALKLMLPAIVANARLRERFKLEARIAADIESEHIVETLDAGVDPDTGSPFILMELLKGDELGALLTQSGRLDPSDVVLYLHQAALALDKTHAAGIVHRDLKPENLFVTYRDDGSPRLKILDFGIAKLIAESSGDGKGSTGVGTPLYMAPEQLQDSSAVGPAADIYALGHITYSLLVGEAYFTSDSGGGVYPLFSKILAGPTEPASGRARRAGVRLPLAFDGWFVKAAAPEPAARFATAGEAVSALAACLGVALPARAPGRGSMASIQDAAPPASPEPVVAPAVAPTREASASGDRSSLAGVTETVRRDEVSASRPEPVAERPGPAEEENRGLVARRAAPARTSGVWAAVGGGILLGLVAIGVFVALPGGSASTSTAAAPEPRPEGSGGLANPTPPRVPQPGSDQGAPAAQVGAGAPVESTTLNTTSPGAPVPAAVASATQGPSVRPLAAAGAPVGPAASNVSSLAPRGPGSPATAVVASAPPSASSAPATSAGATKPSLPLPTTEMR